MQMIDQLIERSLSRRQRNIYGDLGPRCPGCSGLGATLRLAGVQGTTTTKTSPCGCHGSGLDIPKIERADREDLWRAVNRLESQYGLPLTSRFKGPDLKMARQTWMEMIVWATADGTAIANSTTETIIMPNATIPSNYMADGRRLDLTNRGRLSTTSTPTIRFRVRWGGVAGTVLWDSGLVTNASGVTAALWTLKDIGLQVRTNGATGTIFAMGEAWVGGAAAPTVGSATGAPGGGVYGSGGDDTPAAVTVDLAADTALSVAAQPGTQSASNTLAGHDATMVSGN